MLVDVWQLVERAEEVVVVVVVDADAVVDSVGPVNGRLVGDVFGIKPENVNKSFVTTVAKFLPYLWRYWHGKRNLSKINILQIQEQILN